ncbi:MAG: metallophosphatase family protein [Chloroflexota bacterium]|nr:metallophosphatase family protein [Chloroflexota bacterium]
MRIALISDIHGNRLALDAVLRHIEREGVDRIVCLGDIAALGPDPAGAIARVRRHASQCVMGNTDHWLLRPLPGEVPDSSSNPLLNQMTAWAREQLSKRDQDYLKNLPLTDSVELDESRRLMVFHGSPPRSFDDVIGGNTPPSQIGTMLAGHEATIFAGGHTHVRMLRQMSQGVIVNPGSVGLPGVGPGDPGLATHEDVHWADYATVIWGRGAIRTAFHRVPVSVADVLETGRSSGMPGFDWWASKWQSMAQKGSPTS